MGLIARPRPLDLGLVIPVRDDPQGLGRVMAQARALGVFRQIIVIDDGSGKPLGAIPGALVLRHDKARGAGVARNAGLARITTEHVMFCDADDRLTAEVLPLLADLAEVSGGFDLCVFRHADSRMALQPRWGQPDWEDALWQRAGHGIGALDLLAPPARPILAQIANYPWNKVYRTEFLRAHGIGCGTTRAHHDILLHWAALFRAGRVLVSDRICAWHRIASDGPQITAQTGPLRLEVFAALDPVAVMLARAGPDWQAGFAAFCLGLLDWTAAGIEARLRRRLARDERAWLSARLMPWQARIARVDPATAAALRDRATGATA